jgi:hypothetical protein
MAYTPREIKDRVAVGDDIFLVEDLGDNRIRLIPTPTHVSEPGTPVNKALLQPIEDELGRLSSTNPYVQLDYFINSGEITDVAQIAGIKNSLYRGKNLGTSYTSEQQSQVASGKFLDLWVGDYWTINGTTYLIAAFNYYYNTGSPRLTTNHITLVPAGYMYEHRMNPTHTTEGGYTNSEMRTSGLDQAKTKIHADFSGHVITHRRYLCKAAVDGRPDSGAYFDSDVELMNEVMVYGSVIHRAPIFEWVNVGIEKTQLPLFALRSDLINIGGAGWWLRDLVGQGGNFALMDDDGVPSYAGAGGTRGVRPVFSIA